MFVLDVLGNDLAVYTLVDDGLLLGADETFLGFRLLLLGTVDHQRERSHTLKAHRSALILVQQTYAAHVIRIVLDIELFVGVTSAPFQIRLTGGGENLVRVFLSLYRDLDTAGGEQRRFIGRVPEHLHHIRHTYRIGSLVHTGIVHLNPGDAGGRVFH